MDTCDLDQDGRFLVVDIC